MRKKKNVIVILFIILLVILGIIALLLLLNVNKVRKYKDKLSLGKKYLAELDYENAEIIYEEAIRIDAKRPQAYIQLSNVYVAQDRYDDAWDVLERAEEQVTKPQWLDSVKEQKEVVLEAKTQYQNAETSEIPQEESEPEQKLSETFCQGYTVVSKNGWTYLYMNTALYVFHKDSDEVMKKLEGTIEGALMAVDDGVYYCRDKRLEFYSHVTGETTVIYDNHTFVEPLGLTQTYLYFAVSDEMDYDSRTVLQMELASGTVRTLETEGYCMHSASAFCNERFFYLVGVADVGTTSLREVDVVNGTSSLVVEHTGGSLLAKGDILYYVETDQAGDYTQVNATAKAWNTVTNEQVSLMQGPGVQLGSICAVTDTAVYVSMENTYRLANGLTETINGHCDCADGNLIYTSIYEDRSVLCYDETTGVTTNVTALSENEYVVGAADGYLYIHSGDSYRREKIRE